MGYSSVWRRGPPPAYSPAHDNVGLVGRRRGRAYIGISILILALATLFHFDSITGFSLETSPPPLFEEQLQEGLRKCQYSVWSKRNYSHPASVRQENPRWNPTVGQQTTVVLRNATLFDGNTTLSSPVDIVFSEGLIRSVRPSEQGAASIFEEARVIELGGSFVTPGLVDMHSHHLESPFPSLRATGDVNEAPGLGPITPFVRAVDGFKAYDPAIRIIASGGVTTSLNLPGSSNLIGGEAYPVKNLPLPGPDKEPIVEELLLDHGIAIGERRRYLKTACGENPKFKYAHSRPGLAWLLREHLNRARDLKHRQEVWCSEASAVDGASATRRFSQVVQFAAAAGPFPEAFELETSLALLRGDLNVNIHCYEPQDLERTLDIFHEFDIHPRAFHHALSAWRIPEFLKKTERFDPKIQFDGSH